MEREKQRGEGGRGKRGRIEGGKGGEIRAT